MKRSLVMDLSITEFSKEGHGIGYVPYPEGKMSPVEVPFTIPGDQVRVLLLHKYRGIYQSKLEEMIQPSPNRILPRCKHFADCGGCRWQQISYEQELQQKEQFIRHCLAPYLTDQVVFHPILACTPPWNYRNKVELSFSTDRSGTHYLGFIKSHANGRVFKMEECHLVQPWFLDAVEAVNRWWKASGLDAYHIKRNTGSLRTLTIREGRRTGDRMIMLTVSGNPDFALNRQQLNAFVSSLKEAIEQDSNQTKHRLSIFLRIQQIAKGRKTNFYEMLLHGPDHIEEVLYIKEQNGLKPYRLVFKISPTAFFQPNTEQAERLYSCALEMAQLNKDSIVYDLYCGTGSIGMCAAQQVKEVIGIELSPESVLDARENIKNNGLSNMTILQGDVGQVLTQFAAENKTKPDVVIVDPPRAGLDQKTIHYLIEFKPHKIIYISCNPLTQGVNLKALVEGGYRLESVQPIDQFPHTPHVENIVILKR